MSWYQVPEMERGRRQQERGRGESYHSPVAPRNGGPPGWRSEHQLRNKFQIFFYPRSQLGPLVGLFTGFSREYIILGYSESIEIVTVWDDI